METIIVVLVVLAIVVVGGVVALGISTQREAERRKAELLAKYKDAELVERLLEKTIWQGETAAQLSDSLGKPVDVDEKVFKTKRKQIWKYHQDGRDRYRTRITLEDDVVVGWDQR